MPKFLVTSIVALALVVAGGTILAGGPGRVADTPHRYNPQSLDGRLTLLNSATDGRAWAAWAYRSGAQYDIALTTRDDAGLWSEPVFIGDGDGRDQVEPVLAADSSGNLYVAYTDREEGRILLSSMRAGAGRWSAPMPVTAPGSGSHAPALRVVADRLVVAYRKGSDIVIIDLPLIGVGMSLNGLGDHPDPVGYAPPPEETGPGEEDGLHTISAGHALVDFSTMVNRHGSSK